MGFDFGRIKAPKKEDMPTDPIDIFQKNKGKISDSTINDLWLGQGDALREWDANRQEEDVAVVLNTGAGKTLIGLLIAKSLVNETKGCVIYACGSIQLIEQTREKAEGYGIPVTTYYNGNFSNDLFHEGKAPCLTTYQAIFNGKSIFIREDIEAIIFDDAHTAEGMIKNHFSLELDRNSNRDVYDSIISLFRSHYKKVGKETSFNELYLGDNEGVELLPPGVVKANFSEIHRLIVSSGILDTIVNKFAWEHLKNHLDLCSYFVSSGRIQITPSFIPVSTLKFFQKGIRRVYLTATMLGEDAFLRTFGKELKYVVKPKTTAGECERLILFPSQISGYDNELDETKKIISSKKSLILTPSKYQSSRWLDIGHLPDRQDVVESVSSFKLASDNQKLVLAGRYDGIDLPGDTCRYMVLDGLPSGSSLSDKYLWSSLNLSSTLRSTIACRVVQSLGRISRGMSDYGIVIINEKSYVNWLKTPKNMAALPGFVQKQIHLGLQVTESSETTDDLINAADTFMARDPGWSSFYENFMAECEIEKVDLDIDSLKIFAKAEIKFSKYLWEREFEKAAKSLESVLESAFDFSYGLGAWYCLWLGFCIDMLGDDRCYSFYKRAYGASKVIPKHLPPGEDFTDLPIANQVANVVNEFEYTSGSSISPPKNMAANLCHLDGSGSVNQIEESIRFLGQYLGLDSTRPDNEHDIGPDNLWLLDSVALAMEAKTSKTPDVNYSKDYVGQLAQHITWVEDTHLPEKLIPTFVGPMISATTSASPSDDMMVIQLPTLKNLSDRLIAAYDDVAQRALPITLPQHINDIFRERSLLWDQIIDDINFIPLKSL